jgi:glycerophosphoryl diester phosphodiesterase
MVKFGGHVEAFRECAESTDLYLVPYNDIKSSIFQENREKATADFVAAWQEALKTSEDDYRAARKGIWDHIFQVVAQKDPSSLRGSHPGSALKVFVDNTHPDKVHEILSRMDKVHRTASVNSEALRKLVKKHDKHVSVNLEGDDLSVSLQLLPTLYTSSLYSSQSMLQEGIGLVRDLLDEAFSSDSMRMVRLNSEQEHKRSVEVRMDEHDWLKRLVKSIPENLLPNLVAHRGFHHIEDRNDKRPLENSLSAYEIAWTSGIHLCECDIAITKDEKLVLAHDENFLRLALDSNDPNSKKHVSDLTFRELISMPLKSGVRPPLLIDVLRSACAISEQASPSQLVIEIKPGNESAASALARLLIRHHDLRQAVAMIMSFDAVTMHRLRAELSVVDAAENIMPAVTSFSGGGIHHRVNSFDHFGTLPTNIFGSHRRLNSMENLNQTSAIGLSLSQTHLTPSQNQLVEGSTTAAPVMGTPIAEQEQVLLDGPAKRNSSFPKLMLLTVAGPPKRPCEQRVSVDDLSPVRGWLEADSGGLDGVYLQFEKKMMTEEGVASLRALSKIYNVGVWSFSGRDQDDYETFEWLVQKGNCTFVNTDLPNDFRKDIFVRRSSNEST